MSSDDKGADCLLIDETCLEKHGMESSARKMAENALSEHLSNSNLNGNVGDFTNELEPVKAIPETKDVVIAKSTAATNFDRNHESELRKDFPVVGVADTDVESSVHEHKKLVPTREGSPFKEAIKGFVRNKLTKKQAGAESHLGERKTLFSGLKEKLAKRLEDSGNKETLNVVEEFQALSLKSHSASELDIIQHLECELKSVVANENPEPKVVEEGVECFEESKVKQVPDDLVSDASHIINQLSPNTPPTRSVTMSNISGTSCSSKVKSKSAAGMDTISISFSDLQRADDLDENDSSETVPALTNDNEKVVEPKTFSVPQVPQNPQNEENDDLPSSSNDSLENSDADPVEVQDSYYGRLRNKLHAVLKWLLQIHILFLIGAVIVYRIWYSWPFLAGVLCTLLVGAYISLLYYDFTDFLTQKSPGHFPEYKTITTTSKKAVWDTSYQQQIYQGWMNQLLGEYNPSINCFYNTVSVYVRVEDKKITLSYPKRDTIPKQAMWNEKQLSGGSVQMVSMENHFLSRSKVFLLPDDLPRTRTWNCRYPICVVLAERRRSPSVDCVRREEEPEKSTKDSSNLSLPPSLSGSPAHSQLKENTLYLFARTNRDKEEWYSIFKSAANDDENDIEFSLNLPPFQREEDDDTDFAPAVDASIHSAPPTSSTSSKVLLDSIKEEQTPKPTMPQKPVLNFEQYMHILLEQCPKKHIVEKSSVQWLNVLLGRAFYDFHVRKKWAERVQRKIQEKLDRINMSQYMQKLVVTDVYLGKSLPQIRKISQPVKDNRGLWIDLEIDYEGYFQMTLETKFKTPNSSKILAEDQKDGLSADSTSYTNKENILPMNEELADLDDDEDIPEVDSLKDDSPSHSASVSSRLLQSFERWVASSNLADNKFIKRCVDQLAQARLLLTVEVDGLSGTLALNIPPFPTDRLWYGFRGIPEKMSLNVFPKVGGRNISLHPVLLLIKKKLLLEFQKALVMPNMDDVPVLIMTSPFEYEKKEDNFTK